MFRNLEERKYCLLVFNILFLLLLSSCNGVAPNTNPPTINSFTASPPSITSGESSTLNWSVTDADTLSLNQGIGTVTGTAITVSPTTTTTYTLTASNSAGSVTHSVTVTVGAALGSIDIASSPAGANVYLDGVDTGSITPIVLTGVSAGIHTIRLEFYLYESREDTNISVTAGETQYLNWALTSATVQSITLQPDSEEGKDARVGMKYHDQNYGNSDSLSMGYGNSADPRSRSYLYFDVNASLPQDAVVTSALLELHQFSFGGTGSLSIGLYQVTSDWQEDTITWNNQPTSASEAEYTNVASSTLDAWRPWSIGDLVRGWSDGSISNYGMLLRAADEPATNIAYFDSSDYTDASKHPKLLINYYIP